MKTLIAFLLMALPALADVTKTDIKKLLDAKVSDDVIIQYVKANVPVRMTADDLTSLKSNGASDKVLSILISYTLPTTPAPQTTQVVYTYTYDIYPSYYWYGWYWYPRYYVYRRVYRPVVVVRPVVVRPVRSHR